ncbi:MAG: c-type cytochrome biogenesis protein CcmI [Burkholderiales bacterium]|nr:c-type cytochrome biogenesis protein CcmI [Burkholderiales bacterium]
MTSSPLFWAAALALLAGTLAMLLLPLLRRSRMAEAPGDRSAATAVFRDHKRQIEDDYATRTITAEERDAALADLTTRFGHELAQDAPAAKASGDGSRFVSALVLVACVPVLAGAMYFVLGNPAAISAPAQGAAQGMNDPQLVAMVDTLAARLQASPEDGEGWLMLGRSYRALGRYDASALAFGEAAKRMPPNAPLYADWAETVAQAQGRSLVGQPTELLARALALDPKNPKALALSGSAAMERGDPATAAVMWKRLRAVLPPESPDIAEIDAVLARITESAPGSDAQRAVPAPVASAAPGTAAAASASAPTADAAATSSATGIEGRVELDPKLASRAAPNDTVFIFARDPDGSRMPLAALKIAVAELPKSFALTDAMAMSPAATISKAARVVVEARVSRSGNVVAQPGDLAGSSAPVAPGARNLTVTIDRVLP